MTDAIQVCKSCGTTSDQAKFYASYKSKCAECTKARANAYRAANLEFVRACDRERGSLPNRVEARKIYRTEVLTTDRRRTYTGAYQERHPLARKAHVTLNNAVKNGIVRKPLKCEECGSGGKLHGHHDNYSRPLAVQWLCPTCHGALHRERGDFRKGQNQPHQQGTAP